MTEEISVELEATDRNDNPRRGITHVGGRFDLRFANDVKVEESLELLQDLLRETANRFNETTRRGGGRLDDGTTVEWLGVDDEVRLA